MTTKRKKKKEKQAKNNLKNHFVNGQKKKKNVRSNNFLFCLTIFFIENINKYFTQRASYEKASYT